MSQEKRKRGETSHYHARSWHPMCDYRSMQSSGYPRNLAYHHCRQPNQYWLNHNHQNHPPFSSPGHFYPVHQVFMQHGPFGNGGNRFLPAPLPHFPNPVHFPPPVPPANYRNENRRNRNFPDNDQMDEMHRVYHNSHGRNFGQDRFARYEMGQGARPKTFSGRSRNEKNRFTKKKMSGSPEPSPQLSFPVENGTLNNFQKVLDQPADHAPGASFKSTGTSQSEDHERNGGLEVTSRTQSDHVSNDELEGAVGGMECADNPVSGRPHGDDQIADPSVYDKNLIDEGAICDLDGMFRNQEDLATHEDLNNYYFSDENEDEGCDSAEHMQKLDMLTELDSDLHKDDNDCGKQAEAIASSMQGSQKMASPSLCSLSLPSMSILSPSENRNEARMVEFRQNELEDGEDTGDFIDTDLPAQCLLSSSDEMDNESSSESEEDPVFLPDDCVSENLQDSDINSNELPNHCSNSLTVKLDDINLKTSKIQLSCGLSSLENSVNRKPRQKRQCYTCELGDHSSDSENDENGNVSVSASLSACALNIFNPEDLCGDGAAASQVVIEENHLQHNRVRNSSMSHLSPRLPVSPPGAGSEMPLYPEQGAIPAVSDSSAPQEGPGPSVVTAECEPNLADACSFSGHAEPASCSTTASGGACHQQFQVVTDSSACCLSNAGNGPSSTKEPTADGSSPEDPSLSHDNNDNIDMVLLPMEEEIEPVLRLGGLVCSGGGAGISDAEAGSAGFSSQTLPLGSVSNLYEEHEGRCPIDQGHLRGAVPSKEFYELIKTVSTIDSYMRFYDKDGHDVQRERVCGSDDEQGQEDSSKAERLRVDRVMIWNEYEAYVMQFKQIAVSACGQTAVLNVLKALKIPCEKSAVCKVIQGSLRKEDADIPEYLFSRAVAGTTAEELTSGIETLSGGAVGGRFFPFWPSRKVKLLQWLAFWMKRGAIPMATLNLQQGPHSVWQVPDSWHHQMVYGVSHQGLYLTNPLEIVSERSAMKQLCSDSVLMVRRQDIISRFRKTTDLGELLAHPDPRWCTMNVLGQVVNVLREFNMPSVPGYRLQFTSHISIPACYKAGITLFMRKDKAAWATLLSAPDLPVDVQVSNSTCVAGATVSLHEKPVHKVGDVHS